ncbi:class I SAM-dependent methyltransferase [Neptuniibacter halophilus]|uniref:class I SAM-dependent methyltransferase n=1 Tax=Neptuniibacter halophilus TaxID=651666 RepID=UPI002574007D|nr:class I SAM-dependent methyltransferase [Neptuniibacter halophilus]
MSFHKQAPLEILLPQLKAWFDTELGKELLEAESAVVDGLLQGLYGVHLAQFSIDSRVQLFSQSQVSHCFSLVPQMELGMADNCIVADNAEVPLAHESVDVVVLHHALDFTASPHQVLREASRILRPGGHVLIVGFNPLSYWGMYRFCWRKKALPPWSGHFISHGRLSDWLKLLELTELRHLSGYHRLPFESGRWRKRLGFIGGLAKRGPGHSGAFSVLLARKDIAGMTPLRSGWGLRRLISLPVAEPSTRGSLKENS